MASLTIDFFHDAVCCRYFNVLSRMRELAAGFDLDIKHLVISFSQFAAPSPDEGFAVVRHDDGG